MLVDLHTHSTFSDGHYTPAMLVAEAVRSGIGVLAIADHDSWNGVAAARMAAAQYGRGSIRIIPAIELGTQLGSASVHILGYHVHTDYQPLQARMQQLRQGRERRLDQILEKLQALGYAIDAVACDPRNRAVGRPHVARALVARGYFPDVQAAFDALLHTGGPAYVPQPKLAPQAAVALIHAAGGLAVLAHPSELEDAGLARRLLAEYAFDGLEVYHPSASEEQQQQWLQLARARGLYVSGGSDFHGVAGRFPEHLGVFKVEYSATSALIEYGEQEGAQS